MFFLLTRILQAFWSQVQPPLHQELGNSLEFLGKSWAKVGNFPRNFLGFLGFHANEEAGKVSNFSQESLDKIPAFPEAGKMIVTENIHPPFPGILGKPGSRKLEIGPPVSWESWDYLESWEESTKISQENWDYSRSLEEFTIYSWESLENPPHVLGVSESL